MAFGKHRDTGDVHEPADDVTAGNDVDDVDELDGPFDIDDFDWTKWSGCQNVTNDQSVKPTCPGMTLRSSVDLRHPANSADLPLVDPNLKPMESREYSLGFQQDIGNTSALGFRWEA